MVVEMLYYQICFPTNVEVIVDLSFTIHYRVHKGKLKTGVIEIILKRPIYTEQKKKS